MIAHCGISILWTQHNIIFYIIYGVQHKKNKSKKKKIIRAQNLSPTIVQQREKESVNLLIIKCLYDEKKDEKKIWTKKTLTQKLEPTSQDGKEEEKEI